MLVYYRFNNFCSFNCESEFSMSAPAGKVKKPGEVCSPICECRKPK